MEASKFLQEENVLKEKELEEAQAEEECEEGHEDEELEEGEQKKKMDDAFVARVVAYFTSDKKNQIDELQAILAEATANPVSAEQGKAIWESLEAKGRIIIKK